MAKFLRSIKSKLSTPSEIVGWVAVVFGMLGGIAQIWKTHTTKNTDSFSPYYLMFAGIAELLFATQGGMKGSLTILITRICSTMYFIYFLVMMYIHHKPDQSQSQ